MPALQKHLANLTLLILSPVLFLGLMELIFLALGTEPLSRTEDPYVGFSSTASLFVPAVDSQGADIYRTRSSKLEFFNLQAFPRQKAPGTYRIFTLGGSTTYGHPYRDATSFSGWLREFLPAADSSRRWEVINCGGISYASYRAAQLVEELVKYQPDLFIVYSGHNEFLEERTYRSLRAMPRWIRDADELLGRTRTYSALKAFYRKARPQPSRGEPQDRGLPAEVEPVLDNTIGPESYRRDDTLRQGVLEHYRYSLERISRLARAAGAEVVFSSTPAEEKDCSPFKSEFQAHTSAADTAMILRLLAEGDSLERTGRVREALARFNTALSLDDRYAHSHYRLGGAFFTLGEFGEAKRSLRRAIDEDVCPLRALTGMRALVREVAEAGGHPFVDFVAVLEADSRDRYGHDILGEEYFLDHVHLDPEGYRRLALELMETLEGLGALHPGPHWNEESRESISEIVRARLTPEERGLALHQLAKVLNWAGKHEEAARVAEKALAADSTSLEAIWSSLFHAAALERAGRGEEALAHYRRAVRLDPNNPMQRTYLAEALARYHRDGEALEHYDTLDSQDPGREDILQARVRLLRRLGRAGEAAAALETLARRRGPGAPPGLRVELGMTWLDAGRPDKAAAQFRQVLEMRPEDGVALYGLGRAAQARGHKAEAIQYYARAVKANPGFGEAMAALGELLQRAPEGGTQPSKAKPE